MPPKDPVVYQLAPVSNRIVIARDGPEAAVVPAGWEFRCPHFLPVEGVGPHGINTGFIRSNSYEQLPMLIDPSLYR